jgi:hypothetical protein
MLSFADEVEEKGIDDVVETALKLVKERKHNPRLVQSALAVFLTHDAEVRRLGVVVPPLAVQGTFRSYDVKTQSLPATVTIPPGDIEKLDYFRSDYDLNDHHNHWHTVFPFGGIIEKKKRTRTIKRQGELFLYMHAQMLARYNSELLAWDLKPPAPFEYDDVPSFGYYPPGGGDPDLQKVYSNRPENMGWYEEVYHADTTKAEMKKYRDNIQQDMEKGFLQTVRQGKPGTFPLEEATAINTVGFVLEAMNNDLQEVRPGVVTNRDAYGNLHNIGHMKFAEIGYGSNTGTTYNVMADTATSLRDPIFWMWHRHIDEFRRAVGEKYTHNLSEHKAEAKIVKLQIVPRNQRSSETPEGGLATYLTPPNVERNEVNAKLRHEDYKWKITVKNTSITTQMITIRLFIVLKECKEDRNAWIEMDKFTEKFAGRELREIIRTDDQSSVARNVRMYYEGESHCACGWPQNLMLPIGKPVKDGGMKYIAFAILTTGELGCVSGLL